LLLASLLIRRSSFFRLSSAPEDGVLLLSQTLQNQLSPFEINVAVLGQISAHRRNVVTPDGNQGIDAIFTDV
jgi:hypothetical protein